MAPQNGAAGKIVVDIISDTVCPWCYVGKRRLEAAMRQVPGKSFEVRWHPFQLNPQAPKAGVNKQEYYQRKFGPRAIHLQTYMGELFQKEGLPYTTEGMTGSTFNSHRLIAEAGRQGADKQDSVVESLFQAYFCKGEYINDPEILRRAAKEAGLKDADAIVDDEEFGAEEVEKELQDFANGVTGVPLFIIDGKHRLSGAQEPETFVQLFNKLESES